MASKYSADCLFCKISSGAILAKRLAENSEAFIIADIGPQAKKHFLVIPKAHIASLETAFTDDLAGRATIAALFSLALQFAKSDGALVPEGFRSVINTHDFGGQTVPHLHLHLLGGEPLRGSFGA